MSKEYSALINRLAHRGLFRIHPGLDRVRKVLQVLGDPQDQIPVLHIAGTNGKGSVAAGSESVLRQAGYRTGLYTSPHLHDVRERIQINRQLLSISDFWGTAHQILEAERKVGFALTYFEFLTVMAFVAFAAQKVDVAIVETGMGGRWDATNVVKKPILTVITSIGLEHTQWLGHNAQAIAREKGGIIKPGCPILIGARGVSSKILKKIAQKNKAPCREIDKHFRAQSVEVDWQNARQVIDYVGLNHSTRRVILGLLGTYQIDNTSLILAGLETLIQNGWKVPEQAIAEGLARVSWPGRFQWVQSPQGPRVLFDGAHNPPALKRFLETLEQSPWKKTLKTFVFSAYRDKDYQAMLKLIAPHADQLFLCTLTGSRSLSARKIAQAVRSNWQPPEIIGDPHRALQAAIQQTAHNNLVIVTGSLALVGMLTDDLVAEARFPTDASLEDTSWIPESSVSLPIPHTDLVPTPRGKTRA